MVKHMKIEWSIFIFLLLLVTVQFAFGAPTPIISATLCLKDTNGVQIGECQSIERPLTTTKIAFTWSRGLINGSQNAEPVYGYKLYFGKSKEEALTKVAPNIVLPDPQNRPTFPLQAQTMTIDLFNPGSVHGFHAGDFFCATVTEYNATEETERSPPICVFLDQ